MNEEERQNARLRRIEDVLDKLTEKHVEQNAILDRMLVSTSELDRGWSEHDRILKRIEESDLQSKERLATIERGLEFLVGLSASLHAAMTRLVSTSKKHQKDPPAHDEDDESAV